MHKTHTTTLLALTRGIAALTLALILPAAARADHLGMALGADGELYTVTAGTYAALFPGSKACATCNAQTVVLALDTVLPGKPAQRQLVPTTDSGDVESAPALIYEDGSKTLFVVWVCGVQWVNSVIKLSSYDGSQWSDPITIISNPYATKTPPQLAVTRDTHQEPDPVSGNQVTHHRTVLHIVWSEDSASGLYQSYYAPVIFEDGSWIGTAPIPTHLNAFDAGEQAAQAAGTTPISSPLVYTPSVQSGRDTSTVMAGFASDTSGLLTGVEVDVLPEELRMLADACKAAINQGAQYFPNQLATLASQVQAVVTANGGAFQTEALQAISAAAQSQVLAGAPDVSHLADKTRATIVDIGAKFARRGLRSFAPGPFPIAPPQIVEVLVTGAPSHFLQFRVTSTRPVPTAVAASGLELFFSRAGADALAAWTNAAGSAVVYTNTQPDGSWSAVKQLQLSTSLNLQQAYLVLEQRMQY